MFTYILAASLIGSSLNAECVACHEASNHEIKEGVVIYRTLKHCMATRADLEGASRCPGCKHSAADHTTMEVPAYYDEIVDGKITTQLTEHPIFESGSFSMMELQKAVTGVAPDELPTPEIQDTSSTPETHSQETTSIPGTSVVSTAP